MCVFFLNYTPTTTIYTYCYTLSLHGALPIFRRWVSVRSIVSAMTPSPCWDADGDTILVAPPPSQATDTGGGCSSARRMLATVHGGEHAPAAEMGETARGDRIRTCDILLPKQARYRAALLPVPPMP